MKKSFKTKVKSWIFEKFLQRYLVSVDKRFIELFIKFDTKPISKKKIESRSDIEYRRIMKVLNSSRFKDYFYKVVHYDRHTAESLIKPYGNSLKDKIFSFIAKTYIFLFKKELYLNIQQFKRIRDGIISLDKKIDDYMATTTLDERADKAAMMGVISSNTREAQIRLRKIQSSRVSKILAHNLE